MRAVDFMNGSQLSCCRGRFSITALDHSRSGAGVLVVGAIVAVSGKIVKICCKALKSVLVEGGDISFDLRQRRKFLILARTKQMGVLSDADSKF